MEISNILNTLLFVVAGYILFMKFAPVKGLRTLDSRSFQQELELNKDKILIDVREQREYRGGFIPGAINVPLSQLRSRLDSISRDKPIFIYCQSGARSKQAARILLKNEFSNLNHLQRGIISWRGQVKGHKE